LPEVLEEDPSLDVVKLLLEDLQDDRLELQKPKLMVGFSAYESYIAEVQTLQAFESMVFHHYDENADSWLHGILNCVKYLINLESGKKAEVETVDLCIIAALYTPEFTSVLDLPWSWGEPELLDQCTSIRRGSFTSSNKTYSVVAAHSLRMGMVAATILATKLISLCRPRFLVMPGICAGVPGKTNYGDILLANPSWDYQCGKRLTNEDGSQFYIAPHQLHVSEWVEVRALQLSRTSGLLAKIKNDWPADKPDTELRLHSGPVGCGSAVLADYAIVEDIIENQQRTLLGIEMEIYGVYSAANSSPEPKPITFSMKSVCDHADNQKNDKYQKYAAYTSAQAIRVFFESYMSDI
jgi:nucleoside phosphorylase